MKIGTFLHPQTLKSVWAFSFSHQTPDKRHIKGNAHMPKGLRYKSNFPCCLNNESSKKRNESHQFYISNGVAFCAFPFFSESFEMNSEMKTFLLSFILFYLVFSAKCRHKLWVFVKAFVIPLCCVKLPKVISTEKKLCSLEKQKENSSSDEMKQENGKSFLGKHKVWWF